MEQFGMSRQLRLPGQPQLPGHSELFHGLSSFSADGRKMLFYQYTTQVSPKKGRFFTAAP